MLGGGGGSKKLATGRGATGKDPGPNEGPCSARATGSRNQARAWDSVVDGSGRGVERGVPCLHLLLARAPTRQPALLVAVVKRGTQHGQQ